MVADSATPPALLAPTLETWPSTLRCLQQYLVWQQRVADGTGEPTKVPLYRVTYAEGSRAGQSELIPASTTDEDTWTDDATALAEYEAGHVDGIGLVCTSDDGILTVDLDACVRPDGTIEPWAQAWVDRIGSSTEYSPTRCGVHVRVLARKPWADERGSIKIALPGYPKWGSKDSAMVEMLDSRRYCTITGVVPEGCPTELRSNQEAVDALYAWLVAQNPREAQRSRSWAGHKANGHARRATDRQEVSEIPDEEVIQRARSLPGEDGEAIARLFDRGRGRPDESIDDWQMFLILGKVTRDAEQIDRIARSTPLRRPRWDELRCGEPKSLYDIRRAFADLDVRDIVDDRGDDHDAGDNRGDNDDGEGVRDRHGQRESQAQYAADTDEVAELRRQLAAAQQAVADKTAELERTVARDQEIIATQREIIAAGRAELETSKRAHGRALALLMSPLKDSYKKALVHRLGVHNYSFGRPLPESMFWAYVTSEQMQESGIGERSYREATAVLEEMGLLERERREPAPPPPQAEEEEQRERGRPYDVYRPVPTAIERFMARLDADEEFEPAPREVAELEKRREKEKEAKAEAEAREARHRQEMERLTQLKYERDRAQHEVEEHRQAAEHVQQQLAEHQRRATASAFIACYDCGTEIDPAQLRCDECREREQEPPAGAGGALVEDVAALDTSPRVLPGAGELMANVANNSPGAQDASGGMNGPQEKRGPPGYTPADDAVARGLCTPCRECQGRKGERLYRIGEKYFCTCLWPDPWKAADAAWGLGS